MELNLGDEIRNKKTGLTLQVQEKYGHKLVCRYEISEKDLDDWEVVDTKTPLKTAALDLGQNLRSKSWFLTIGVDETNNLLYVYTSKRRCPKPFSQYQGYRVKYKYMGGIAPLGGL